jgi:hypothetical protein
MDLRTKKYTIIEKIMQLDEDAIAKLEATLNEVLVEGNMQQYNKELNEADSAMDQGKYIEHNEAVKKIRSWRLE